MMEEKEMRTKYSTLILAFLLIVMVGYACIYQACQLNKQRTEVQRLNDVIRQRMAELDKLEPQDKLAETIQKMVSDRISQLQPKIDPMLAQRIAGTIVKNCQHYDLSVSLVVHLIYRESSFNSMSTSSKGAKGLMQVMDKVHEKEIKEMKTLSQGRMYHIDTNIKFGCMILAKYISRKKSLEGALKQYVGGDGDNTKKYLYDIFRLMAEWDNLK